MPTVSDKLAAQLSEPAYDRAVLLSPADLTAAERQAIPSWWMDSVQRNHREAMAFAMARWNAILPGKLARTTALMRKLSKGVHLGYIDHPDETFVLVYALRNSSKRDDADPFVCWYGYPPARRLFNDQFDVERLPQSVRTFYTRLHNELRLAGFGPTGFMQIRDMFALDTSPIDFEHETVDGHRPATADLVALLLSPVDTMCVELSRGIGDRPTAWALSEATLRQVGSLWNAVDELIVDVCNPFAA